MIPTLTGMTITLVDKDGRELSKVVANFAANANQEAVLTEAADPVLDDQEGASEPRTAQHLKAIEQQVMSDEYGDHSEEACEEWLLELQQSVIDPPNGKVPFVIIDQDGATLEETIDLEECGSFADFEAQKQIVYSRYKRERKAERVHVMVYTTRQGSLFGGEEHLQWGDFSGRVCRVFVVEKLEHNVPLVVIRPNGGAVFGGNIDLLQCASFSDFINVTHNVYLEFKRGDTLYVDDVERSIEMEYRTTEEGLEMYSEEGRGDWVTFCDVVIVVCALPQH